MTLESLRAQLDRAVENNQPGTAASARMKARYLARELGQEIPDWARNRTRATASTPKIKPRGEPPSGAPLVPAYMPPELSAFRSKHPGAIVHVRDGAVAIFLRFGEPPIRFASVHAAVQALALDATG